MLDDGNPYEAPRCVVAGSSKLMSLLRVGPIRLHAAWLVVLLLNGGPGIYFGWWFLETSGKLGMLAAVIVLFALGSWACVRAPRFGSALIVGGGFLSLTQVFPVLQLLSAAIGMGCADAFGQKDDRGDITSEIGGFLVTLMTGSLLMTLSITLGLILQALTPAHWWKLNQNKFHKNIRNKEFS